MNLSTVVFEDSPFGVLGAKTTGAYTVALPNHTIDKEGTKGRY